MSTLPGDDHTSSPTSPLDGRGGTDSAAKVRKSTKKTGSSYVYYRLYTKVGAFESNHALYCNDRFIGRIPSKLFSPPHTVASIKRSLCKLEGLSEPDKALVFSPFSSPAPKEDSARLFLYAPSGPGLSEQDPIALVVESEKRTEELSQSEKLPERSDDNHIHYVYYRTYSSEGKGEEKAKTSFDESDISLGRINTLFIAPPHTAGSLKACIAKVEGLVTPGHALYKDMELFDDMDNDAAMSDADVISFLGDTYPGSDEGDPVALANATTNTAVDQKAKHTPGKVLNEYPLDTAATNCALSDGPDPKFTKRARLTSTYDFKVYDPNWLSINKDEIVYTDGVILSMRYSLTGATFHPGYMAINSKGEKGFVQQAHPSSNTLSDVGFLIRSLSVHLSDTVTSSSDGTSFRFMSIASYLCVNRQLSFHALCATPTFWCIVHMLPPPPHFPSLTQQQQHRRQQPLLRRRLFILAGPGEDGDAFGRDAGVGVLLGDSKNSNTTTSSERNDTHDDDESVSESDHTGSVDMSLFKSEDSILGWVVNVGEAPESSNQVLGRLKRDRWFWARSLDGLIRLLQDDRTPVCFIDRSWNMSIGGTTELVVPVSWIWARSRLKFEGRRALLEKATRLNAFVLDVIVIMSALMIFASMFNVDLKIMTKLGVNLKT
ncbi:hypothetical protein K443DRAFT_3517 [Laccaria amethystina LaAM-08-1]|uniref:Uncharacterized protein n=1 Tax=Laccaria amethystina LaAM-08-1 TaxID=1095629 RepID=A0A0C9XWN0_9AGAR|nr:hypothetical protein K443DRAFT_3517 [Laccaria amethystina LaAM-08-1]